MNPPTSIAESQTAHDIVFAQHLFSPEERLTLGQDLIAAIDRQSQIDAEFESVKAEFKGRVSKAEIETSNFAAKLRDGFEMRQTPSVIAFNYPAKGRKAFFRENEEGGFGDFIREESMTQADFQLPLIPPNENNPHQGDPTDLPEAHEKAPTCTVSVNGGPEVPFPSVAAVDEVVKKMSKRGKNK